MSNEKPVTGREIIEDLLETISWLGGNSYEQEAIAESIKKAEDYLNRKKGGS